MSAFVTDQFRILNAGSFVESISNNSYYAFLGLSNPTSIGFGRDTNWDTSTTNNPVDNFQYLSHYRDTSLFGKKITTENARRVIRKVEWVANTPYDMYRHDYRQGNEAPVSKTVRLYDANYYIITSEFKVYICLDNGSSGVNPTVTGSAIEPTQTDVEPVTFSDGYRWKYLFSISPSDVIKFDSTEYITVPNDWLTTTDSSIQIVREGGDSDTNNNQLKVVYIEDGGSGYNEGATADIIGDGTGGKVSITVDSAGTITDVAVTNGGKGYTYGIIDLPPSSPSDTAKLIPIIPPSKGHGYNIYEELGTDKVLMYARFDDSTKDFPIDTKFAQVGIIKNPEEFSGAGTTFTGNVFSSLSSIGLSESRDVIIGEQITQSVTGAKGYVASFDKDTKVLKYYQDRSLYFGNKVDQTLSNSTSNIIAFDSTNIIEFVESGGTSSINTDLNGSVVVLNSKQINLGVNFTDGLADPQINKKTGTIIYIDNRPTVQRDSRQKEDIKIILEF
jgi:hypothetical protein